MIIDQAQCPKCKRTIRVRADGHTLYTHGPKQDPCAGSREPFAVTPVEPAPVVEPETCDHMTGNPGCDLPDCNGVPTDTAIAGADSDRSTPSDTPTPGEYGVDGAIRTLRAQIARTLDGADVTMPTRSASRAQAYGRPGRPFAVFHLVAAGREVTVVEYPSRGPLNPHRTDVYAVFVDGEMITGECRPVRTGWDWTALAIARLIADHVERTATDADRARRDRALTRAHATTWAIGQGMPSDVAVAYGEWFVINGDPDIDHSRQIDDFARVRPDMVDASGRPVVDVDPVEPAPVASVEPAPVDTVTADLCQGDTETDSGPYPCRTVRPCREHDGPADVDPVDVVEPAPVAAPVVAVAAPVEPAPLPTFTVTRSALVDALAYVSRAVPSRPTLPILSGALITVTPDAVTVEAYDYVEHRAYRLDPVGRPVTPGRALVSARTLADVVKALPKNADRVDVGTDGSRLTVSAGTRRYTLPTMPAEDYPTVPARAPHVGTVDVSTFADRVARVTVAAGRDDTLPVLTGVSVTLDASGVTLWTTDRYRLATAVVPWAPVDGLDPVAVLPHARTLADAVKFIGGAAGKASGRLDVGAVAGISAGPDARTGRFTLSWGPYTLTLDTLDGEFPRVSALLPDGYGARATVTAKALTESVKAVAVVAEKATPVRLTVDPDEMIIAAGGTEDASASDTVPCEITTGTFTENGTAYTLAAGFMIAFNHAYLLDGIKVIGTDRLTVAVTDPKRPAVLDALDADGPAVRYLIMPVRTGADAGEPVPVEPDASTDTDSDPVNVEPVEPAPVADVEPAHVEPVASTDTDGDPVEPVADTREETTVTAIDTAGRVPAYDRAARDARAHFDAGRWADALAALATVPDGYRVAGRHPVGAIRARIERAAREASPVVEPAPVAVVDVEPVAVVEPVADPMPDTLADVEPAPSVDPADAVAVVAAETAAIATVTAVPADAGTDATDPGTGPLVFTLPGYALLSAGGSSYRAERKIVRKALHAARRTVGVLVDVVARVEAVDGRPAAFTVEFNTPDGVDPVAVRRAVAGVVTGATVTVVDTVPAN